jgi:hypothetical protein
MSTLAKGMIGLAALIAAGFVTFDSLTDTRPTTPASTIADRFVFSADIPGPAAQGVDLTAARRDAAAALAAVTIPMDAMAKKGDRLAVAATATRSVTVERRTAPSASELVRYDITNIASRH